VSGGDNPSLTVRTQPVNFVIEETRTSDSVVIYSGTNTQTVYLPDAVSNRGRILSYVNAGSSTLNVFTRDFLDGNAGGSATPVRCGQYVSDGTGWWTISIT